MPSQLIGHNSILEALRRAHERERLAHACLFVGPANVGKNALARAFLVEILGSETPLERHPDFSMVERGRDPKTGKLHGSIVLDQIQALCSRLSMAAFMGGWKVCLIEGVEWLTVEAANALLKNLEEPHPKTLFIATAESLERVLPTVRSRCQTIRFGRVPTLEIAKSLEARGVSATEAAAIAHLADGRPGRALAFAENPELRSAFVAMVSGLADLAAAGSADRLAAVDKLLPPALPFVESSERAADIIDRLVELLRDALLAAAGCGDSVMHLGLRDKTAALSKRGVDRIAAALETALEAKKMLEENVAPRAALDRVVLQL
ncbi:MAG: hypothetical protein AAB692_01130 [Patescibacteria group bacterium]